MVRGMRSSERRVIERLFRELRWVPIDEDVARRAARKVARGIAVTQGSALRI